MPGCLSYIVAEDLADADTMLVTEVWDSKAAPPSLADAAVGGAAIAKGRPLIAGFDTLAETRPISGASTRR